MKLKELINSNVFIVDKNYSINDTNWGEFDFISEDGRYTLRGVMHIEPHWRKETIGDVSLLNGTISEAYLFDVELGVIINEFWKDDDQVELEPKEKREAEETLEFCLRQLAMNDN